MTYYGVGTEFSSNAEKRWAHDIVGFCCSAEATEIRPRACNFDDLYRTKVPIPISYTLSRKFLELEVFEAKHFMYARRIGAFVHSL